MKAYRISEQGSNATLHVFTDKAKAERYHGYYDGAEIEELIIDESPFDKSKEGFFILHGVGSSYDPSTKNIYPLLKNNTSELDNGYDLDDIFLLSQFNTEWWLKLSPEETVYLRDEYDNKIQQVNKG